MTFQRHVYQSVERRHEARSSHSIPLFAAIDQIYLLTASHLTLLALEGYIQLLFPILSLFQIEWRHVGLAEIMCLLAADTASKIRYTQRIGHLREQGKHIVCLYVSTRIAILQYKEPDVSKWLWPQSALCHRLMRMKRNAIIVAGH